MPIKHTSERDVIERHLRHFVKQFETMGARITMLAQALGVPLRTPADIDAALQCDGTRYQGREARMREELRALLVLRYQTFERLAYNVNVGPQAARDILLSANDRLLRNGFPAEAPGMNLRPFFDGIED